MKWTRSNVEAHAQNVGYEPVQIDGIPEGFSFLWKGMKIGNRTISDRYVVFVPLTNIELSHTSKEVLLYEYKHAIKNRNGK